MRSDDRGVLGMPVRLAVAVLVIATMTPIVLGMVDDAEETMTSSGLESEADRLYDGISRAYYGGEGTVVTVDLSLRPGQSLAIGGDGADRYAIRLLEDGDEVGRVYMERPSVPVLGGTTVISGETSVRLRCTVTDGTYGVGLVRCWSSPSPA